MYYGLIVVSVVMFGFCFKLSDVYRRVRGAGLAAVLSSALVSSLASIIPLAIIAGFNFESTPFTIIMAFSAALNGMLFTYCSLKALGKIDLALYSLFSMLGGMILPFVQGIAFYGEPITLAKGVCFVLISIALLISTKTGGKSKGGFIYYIGIFVLNGMSGVLSRIYVSSPYPKTSSSVYSLWGSIISFALAAIVIAVLLALGKINLKGESLRSVSVAAANGVVNKIANLLLVISLAFVDSSLQYPMVTGGVMIVSTVFSLLDKEKKTELRELISVALAFLGTLALFLIPI